jgi:hypothetical protein
MKTINSKITTKKNNTLIKSRVSTPQSNAPQSQDCCRQRQDKCIIKQKQCVSNYVNFKKSEQYIIMADRFSFLTSSLL